MELISICRETSASWSALHINIQQVRRPSYLCSHVRAVDMDHQYTVMYTVMYTVLYTVMPTISVDIPPMSESAETHMSKLTNSTRETCPDHVTMHAVGMLSRMHGTCMNRTASPHSNTLVAVFWAVRSVALVHVKPNFFLPQGV